TTMRSRPPRLSAPTTCRWGAPEAGRGPKRLSSQASTPNRASTKPRASRVCIRLPADWLAEGSTSGWGAGKPRGAAARPMGLSMEEPAGAAALAALLAAAATLAEALAAALAGPLAAALAAAEGALLILPDALACAAPCALAAARAAAKARARRARGLIYSV